MKNRETLAIPANRRNVERMSLEIQTLKEVMNDLLEENRTLKKRLVEEYDCAHGTRASTRRESRPMMKGEKIWM
jgi:hypothetical protein